MQEVKSLAADILKADPISDARMDDLEKQLAALKAEKPGEVVDVEVTQAEALSILKRKISEGLKQ